MVNINYNDSEIELNKIIAKNTISSIKDLEILVYNMIKHGFTIEEIKRQVENFNIKLRVKNININNIIDVILKKDFTENSLDCQSDDIILYQSEIDYLLIIKNEEVRKILYLLLVISKWSNHPSGWIKYDRKYLFNFWDMGKYKESKKVELINECCRSGLELRVIGSKHPVACFRVNFRTFDSEQIVVLKDNEDIKNIYDKYLSLKEKKGE